MTAVQHTSIKHNPAASSRSSTTLADVTERLMAEFEDRLDLATISRVVSQAWHELHPVPDGPLPEFGERLARQRLLDQPTGRVAVPPPWRR